MVLYYSLSRKGTFIFKMQVLFLLRYIKFKIFLKKFLKNFLKNSCIIIFVDLKLIVERKVNNMTDFEKAFYEVEDLLKDLEELYEVNMISLKSYFEVKGNIIEKLINISSEEQKLIVENWKKENQYGKG